VERERDDEDRLIDVLLTEELGRDDAEAIAHTVRASGEGQRRAAWSRAAAATPTARPHWLAAAGVLLGVAVVTTMLVWPKPAERARPMRAPQDPVPGPRVEARDVPHFVALVGKARALQIERSDTIGATHVQDASGNYDRLDTVRWPEVVRYDGEPLAAWHQAIAASSSQVRQINSIDVVLNAVFELADGSRLPAMISVGEPIFLDPCIGVGMIVPDDRLAGLLRTANAELERQHRLARGTALDTEQLAALPAASARVECPVLADGSLGSKLQRFTALQTLVVRAGEGGRGVDDALLRGLQALRSVTSLELPADALTDASCALLAGMPALQRLVLRGAGEAFTGTGFAAFTTPALREVVLWNCSGLTEDGMAALARLRGLQVLRLLDVELGPGAALLGKLPSFAALRELAVRNKQLRGEQLAPLLQTRLQKLVLVDAAIRGDALARLGELPSLRELEFVSSSLDDDQVEDLAKLGNLQRLRFGNAKLTADGLARLRAVLPGCTVDGVPGSRRFDTASWFAP
jgi:hypothetical protein